MVCQPRLKIKRRLFSEGFTRLFDLPFISNIFGFIQSELGEMIEKKIKNKNTKTGTEIVKMFSFLGPEYENVVWSAFQRKCCI